MIFRRLSLFLLAPVVCSAQLWTGILNRDRAIAWENSVNRTVPSVTTQCGSTIAAYTGTAGTINTALSGCTVGQFVLLGSGTFTLSTTIKIQKGVVLRGSGPLNTIVKYSATDTNCGAGQQCNVLIGTVGLFENSADVQPGNSNALAITGTTEGGAGVYPEDATHLTVGIVGTDTPIVGTLLFCDQVNDQTPVAGVIQGDSDTVTAGLSMSGNDGAFGRSPGSGQANAAARRSQTQVVKITNIAGSTYTVTPGIYFNNIRSGQSPGCWWNTSSNKVAQGGLENLTLDDSGGVSGQGATFTNCDGCWIKNVRFVCTTATCPRSHIGGVQSFGIIVRDSYLFGAQSGGGAEGYGLEYSGEVSACLVENNIFEQNIAPWINGNLTGCAFTYNFTWNNITATSTFMQGSYTSHDSGCGMNLYEGNDLNALFGDNQHGASPLYILFRNHLGGQQPVPNNKTNSGSAQTIAFNEDSYNRVGSLVGNVLGMITCVGGANTGLPVDRASQCPGGTATGASYHTQYECSPVAGCPSQLQGNQAIYNLGYGDGLQIGNPGPSTAAGGNDNEVITSLMRWGNCDSFNGACRFVNAEVPTTGNTFYSALSIPGNHNLPNSFIYSTKPAWWNGVGFTANPWPAVGPDISGGDLATSPSGVANRNLARQCWDTTAQDATNYPSTVVKAFDAAACYTTAVTGSIGVIFNSGVSVRQGVSAGKP